MAIVEHSEQECKRPEEEADISQVHGDNDKSMFSIASIASIGFCGREEDVVASPEHMDQKMEVADEVLLAVQNALDKEPVEETYIETVEKTSWSQNKEKPWKRKHIWMLTNVLTSLRRTRML